MKLALVAIALLLAACPRFHADKLPGAPADATFAEIDGVHVRYVSAGEGPAVVFVHGFGASSDAWRPVMPAVVAAKHRAIAVDMKGFGWSSRPEGDYSPAAQAALVWKLLDKLGVKDVAIVGHSWGSSISLAMAVAHPDRVRRVVLYDAYVYDEQVPSFFRWGQKGGIGEFLFGVWYRERIEDRAPLAYYDHRWITQARVDRVEADMDKPGTTAAALAAVRGHHFAALHDQLRAFTKPVLILWGENDEVTPVRFGHQLAAELHDATMVTYPRCGHIPMVEAQVPSTRDLLAFLGKDAETVPAPAQSPAEPESPQSAPATTPSSTSLLRPAPTTTTRASAASPDHAAAQLRTTSAGPAASASASASASAPASASASASASAPAAASVTASMPVATSSTGGGAGPSPSPITVASTIEPRLPVPPPLPPLQRLPLAADLVSLGAELAPRAYAAPREKVELTAHGGFRVIMGHLFNFDLDRGLDSRGQPAFPIPLGGGQEFTFGNLRARTDLAAYAPGVGVAVKTRIDILDNIAIGDSPSLRNGSPATATGQEPSAVIVKRAYGEVLLPFGTLAIGRMGAHLGLGMVANGGDCEDCDRDDATDRVALVTPVLGHVLALAYDISARGPFTRSRDGGRAIALDPSDRVGGPTLAILKVHTPAALARRAAARLLSYEYAAYITSRSQENDVPASYLPTASPRDTYSPDDLVARGFTATGLGGWFRLTGAGVRIEAELAYASANLEHPSLIPGADITLPVTSSQLGFALQSSFDVGPAQVGFDGGYASGDDAPGFGAYPSIGEAAPTAGAVDGPQANVPRDRTVDNFRFHPNYRVDQILFREILGTITDAIYVRPHARIALLEVGSGRLELGAALIASWAVEATSTPSGARHLGVELDPQIRYASADGFAITIDYGLLLPGAAWDNTNISAKPAQSIRTRLGFYF